MLSISIVISAYIIFRSIIDPQVTLCLVIFPLTLNPFAAIKIVILAFVYPFPFSLAFQNMNQLTRSIAAGIFPHAPICITSCSHHDLRHRVTHLRAPDFLHSVTSPDTADHKTQNPKASLTGFPNSFQAGLSRTNKVRLSKHEKSLRSSLRLPHSKPLLDHHNLVIFPQSLTKSMVSPNPLAGWLIKTHFDGLAA